MAWTWNECTANVGVINSEGEVNTATSIFRIQVYCDEPDQDKCKRNKVCRKATHFAEKALRFLTIKKKMLGEGVSVSMRARDLLRTET